MNEITVKSLDEFMKSLSIDTKNDKIRDFLRFVDAQDTYFTEDDSLMEIRRDKNVWAGYAYLVFMDKLNGNQLTEREELFLNKYFESYLLTAKSEGYEKALKGLYIKYRLSDDFPYNTNAISKETLWANHPEFEQGLDEYVKTIKAAISEIYGVNIDIDVEVETFDYIPKSIAYFSKKKNLVLNERVVSHNYIDMLRENNNAALTYDLIYKICTEIELTELNTVRRTQVGVKPLIYTVEDYLYSKSIKQTGISKVYNALYTNVLANKQIDIDAKRNAFDRIMASHELYSGSEYKIMNSAIERYFSDVLSDNNHLYHYMPDAKYFDTNNLEQDGFSKLFAMYVNGLKAMPKTKLTNVTKYFVVNGNTLTALDMALILKDYDYKISKLDPNNDEVVLKRDALIKERAEIKEVIDYIKTNVVSYQIEEKLLKLTIKDDLSSEERNDLYEDITNMCFDNYSEYLEMKYRIAHMCDQLDNLAGSNSPSKISLIRHKEEVLSKMIKKFEEIDMALEWKKLQLAEGFEFEDASRNIVIHNVKDMTKVLTIVQELIGRGVITSESMINDSIKNGTPIMRNLNPGFKEFVQDALACKGVKEFKKKKNKKK